MGVALHLLVALLDHEVLGGEDAYGCVTSATFCLCESSDARVAAAGITVLNASLASRRSRDASAIVRNGEGSRGGLKQASAAALKAAASARVLSAVESLLQFRDGTTAGIPDLGAVQNAPFAASYPATVVAPTDQLVGTKRVDGCAFGAPLWGMLDAPTSLLASVITALARTPASGGSAISKVPHTALGLSHQRLWMKLCAQLALGGSGELSPVGLACALRYVERVAASALTVDMVEFLLRGKDGDEDESLITILCRGILGRQHLQAVVEWPPGDGRIGGGGGEVAGAAMIVTAAVGVLKAPLDSKISPEALTRVKQAMHDQGVVAALLGATRVLCQRLREKRSRKEGVGQGRNGSSRVGDSEDGGADAKAAVCACVDLLSRLVLLKTYFSQQFLEEGGLADLASAEALSESSPTALVTGALVVVSQLARASADNYAHLRATGVDASLPSLLAHADPGVRAKACNLVGNLCRHSGFFYGALQGVSGTADDEVFENQAPWGAVHGNGNGGGSVNGAWFDRDKTEEAARRGGEDGRVDVGRGRGVPSLLARGTPEHSDHSLYLQGRRDGGTSAVDRLVGLCADPDPSVRKFACFAVGNAAFHNNTLYARLAPAVGLLVAALHDPEEKTRTNAAGALGNLVRNGGELSGDVARAGGVAALLDLATREPAAPPRRTALFTLGTCCAFAPCREALALLDDDGEDRVGLDRGGVLQDLEDRQQYNGDGGGRPKWNIDGGGGWKESPAPCLGAQGLGRRLLELEQAVDGDDVARKYVARLKTKLLGGHQA